MNISKINQNPKKNEVQVLEGKNKGEKRFITKNS